MRPRLKLLTTSPFSFAAKRESRVSGSPKPPERQLEITEMETYQINSVMHGDCVAFMRRMESESIDFILTDPPYITRYRSRDGRTVINDDNARWLRPAFTQMYRLLKNGSFCLSFYRWNKASLVV